MHRAFGYGHPLSLCPHQKTLVIVVVWWCLCRFCVPCFETPTTYQLRITRAATSPTTKDTRDNKPVTPAYITNNRWKATMQDYFLTMHALGVRLTGLLSVSLGLESSFFELRTSEMAHALRLIHYSAEVRHIHVCGRVTPPLSLLQVFGLGHS